MNIRPRNDQVLVQLDPIELRTAGGLYLPEAAAYAQGNRPDARKGTVLAVGPGKWGKRGERIPCQVQVGNRVMINGWLNDSVKRGVYSAGEDDLTVMVKDEDIFLVLEESEAAAE